ncbi:MAG: PD-(D/E)XK nuclease family protein [Opitutales bacterium]|nr:PD-(D/E)XK nuclease family protein [Opitutales bacterium]
MIERKFISPLGTIPEISAKWFVDTFAEKLTQVPVSFSDVLVLVPTRASAKNLREAILGECFAREVYGVCELNIKTLEDELTEYQKQTNAITAIETRATWIASFQDAPLENFTGLFPFTTPSRNDYSHLAKELEFLQNTLAENLQTISSASDKLADSPDNRRWQDLKQLEIIFNNKVQQGEKLTRIQSLKSAIEKSTQSGNWKHVVVIGNPDASAVLKEYLTQLDSNGTQITIVIISDDKNAFDEYGTPIPDIYSEVNLSVEDSDINVYIDVKKQAQAIVNLAKAYDEKAYDVIAISCDQKKSIDIFRSEFAKNSINAISLEAESLEKTELFNFISCLYAYYGRPNFKNFLNFVRNPIVLKNLESISKHSATDILADLDFIAEESLCSNVAQAKSTLYARINPTDSQNDRTTSAFIKIKYLRTIFDFAEKCLNANKSASDLLDFISEILPEELSEKNQLAHSVLLECVENIVKAEEFAKIKFSIDEVFSIIINYIKSVSTKIDLEDKRIPLQDWMEIYWSTKPQLLLCDMNDGIVPLSNSDGKFLNDLIRKKLGLRHQYLRQARDAYMLDTLKKSRKNGGAITICVPRQNLSADPLMPSRILFQTENLAQRTQLLFKTPTINDSQQPYTPEWNLNVPTKKFKGKYSATKLNTYLDSPWQFYLQYVLSMGIVETQNDEMDAMQFGNIFHKILYKFAVSNIKDSIDEKEISDFLLKEFLSIENEMFGTTTRAQVRVQLENLKNRILACAKVQVEHRKQGWKILYAEKPFEIELCGQDFTGVFDRIDINENTGQYLVLDYKTYDRNFSEITKSKHLQEINDEVFWKNLQLPLYVCVANVILQSNNIICGYFVAPKNITQTSIDIWEDVCKYQESALDKMMEIITSIQLGKFAPEVRPTYDNYNSVFNLNFDILKEIVKFEK